MPRLFACLLLLLRVAAPALAAPPATSAYLFVYFTGNDNKKQEEAIRFALSPDGYHYTALNGDRPVISSAAISKTGGVRDPHILRGADGKTFYMAATDMSVRSLETRTGKILRVSSPVTLLCPSALGPTLL